MNVLATEVFTHTTYVSIFGAYLCNYALRSLRSRMPTVEEDIARIMKKNLSLAAFLPNSKELIGVVVLCPKEGPMEFGAACSYVK